MQSPIRSHSTSPRFYLYSYANRSYTELRNGLCCGRSEGEITFPADRLVSRKHCRFAIAGHEIYVEDAGSTNPTRVNTVPLRARIRRRIRINDVIEIGNQRFVLTNQTRHAPGNAQYFQKALFPYPAVRNDEGTLTSSITRFFDRTLVFIDRSKFHKLQVRKAVRRVKRHSPRAVVAAVAVLMVSGLGFLGWGLSHPGGEPSARNFAFQESRSPGAGKVSLPLNRELPIPAQPSHHR